MQITNMQFCRDQALQLKLRSHFPQQLQLHLNHLQLVNFYVKNSHQNTSDAMFLKDVTGVGHVGALKNIYAIGAGICDGLELGNNAKAAFISRSIAEMGRIIDFLSPGSSQSLMGYPGLETCN